MTARIWVRDLLNLGMRGIDHFFNSALLQLSYPKKDATSDNFLFQIK